LVVAGNPRTAGYVLQGAQPDLPSHSFQDYPITLSDGTTQYYKIEAQQVQRHSQHNAYIRPRFVEDLEGQLVPGVSRQDHVLKRKLAPFMGGAQHGRQARVPQTLPHTLQDCRCRGKHLQMTFPLQTRIIGP